MNNTSNPKIIDTNPDPITGEPGSHPIGTGLGAAAGGAVAGAAVGTVAGPIGTAIGAAVGAVVGGLAGKGLAEVVDPTAETAYWRDNYNTRPYIQKGDSFDDYGPAYRYGVDSSLEYDGRRFEDVEADLSSKWDSVKGTSSLGWDRARHATRDSWDRIRRQD